MNLPEEFDRAVERSWASRQRRSPALPHGWWVPIGIMLAMLVATFFAGRASAQTVEGTLRIGWAVPTTGCNDLLSPPVCGPLSADDAVTSINLYISTSPIPDDTAMPPTLVIAATPNRITHTMRVTAGQVVYIRARALNRNGPSPYSDQISKVIEIPMIPGMPTEVTIELQIGAP